ncbi:MAG: UDP-glucose 6-dehydrogenase, partial [Clostridia bacterium]|nr:UDP-glucose 6-dehydrogenase [Clostridia bacterium]
MNIAIAGIGYVGLSNAVLLAQKHTVWAVDVVQDKVDAVNRRQSPIADPEIEDYLAHRTLTLSATTDGADAYREADLVVISTPTNYDPERNHFDTSLVEAVIEQVLRVRQDAFMIIKSTVPVGYTASVCEKYGTDRILFSPEFLR